MKEFDKNEEFCPHCLIHESFYVGGGSWSPDRCPNHKKDEFILWKQMSFFQKRKAVKLFNQMWKKERRN